MTKEELIKKISAEIAKLSDNASQMCEEYEGYRLACQDISDVLHEITKEIQPSLPSNLDEVAIPESEMVEWMEYGPHTNYPWCGIPDAIKITAEHFFALGKQAGAEWIAGQFRKIEGELVDWYSTSDGKDYCCGIKTSDPLVVPEGFYIRKK